MKTPFKDIYISKNIFNALERVTLWGKRAWEWEGGIIGKKVSRIWKARGSQEGKSDLDGR